MPHEFKFTPATVADLDPWWPGKIEPEPPPPPPARLCAWCGSEVAAKRPGRKGAHAFCGADCGRLFFERARAIGTAILDGSGEAARDYCENSGGPSADDPSPPEINND